MNYLINLIHSIILHVFFYLQNSKKNNPKVVKKTFSFEYRRYQISSSPLH